jgi:hypothetical protein
MLDARILIALTTVLAFVVLALAGCGGGGSGY